MSDDQQPAENLEEEPASEDPSKKKKLFNIAALLPNLLKFVAIGLGAIIIIVTVAVITYNILNKGGKSQTMIPESPSYVGSRPQYSMFNSIGTVRARSKDPTPYTVMVEMILAYDLNDAAAASELSGRLIELQDFVRHYFSGKYAAELQPENEARLKQDIMEQLNTRLLNTAKVRMILFRQLDAMEM